MTTSALVKTNKETTCVNCKKPILKDVLHLKQRKFVSVKQAKKKEIFKKGDHNCSFHYCLICADLQKGNELYA